MRVLFWNTNKNANINPVLLDLIAENNISIVVLAEYSASREELLKLLFLKGIEMESYISVGCNRISIFGSIKTVTPGRQTDYASFQIVNETDILCCVHLPSKIYNDSDGTRRVAIGRIISDIESTEKEIGTTNTILVGDMNINPFDCGCLDATQIHGVPIFETTKKGSRRIEGQEFKMFYNPMWRFLGDKQKPYGTYYYSGNDTCNTFWKIYDQVIIRPSLKDRFVDSSLKILTETKSKNLLNRVNHPDKKISDHLPIIFEIQEEYNGTQI